MKVYRKNMCFFSHFFMFSFFHVPIGGPPQGALWTIKRGRFFVYHRSLLVTITDQ